MRILRLFAILDQLRVRRRPVSADYLAQELNVSLRTIYRDMKTLQNMGAPVRGEGGVGYQIEKGYFLPPLHFSHDELDAIVIGMGLVAARTDLPLAKAAKSASAKINAVLSNEYQGFSFNSKLLVHVEKEKIGEKSVPFLSPVRQAIRQRQLVEITYKDLQEQNSKRIVRPLGLTAFEKVWLLTAWCEYRQDFRNFRVDRILSLTRSEKTFPRERGRELKDYLATL
ncbi:MAG: YafY family transcriptional regulator [Devosiaceae bacterium]|nr:YafY family transcriptional regulator [Devosiaceae bacterium]